MKREKVAQGKVSVVYTKDLDYNVPKILLDYIHANKIERAIDLGSGYGFLLYTLAQYDLLPGCTLGVDFRFAKCCSLKGNVPSARILCADITRELIKDNVFDLVINEQVIEHIEDEDTFLRNIYRILKGNGKLYISSIIRKPRAWWFYQYKGETRLNPYHLREYKSVEEFIRLLENNGFKVLVSAKKHFVFHLFYWLDILCANFFRIDTQKLATLYDRSLFFRLLRRHLGFIIPGFYIVEALVEKV